MKIQELVISTEYIQLNQLLKYCDIVSSGGEVKFFFEENDILYNNTPETRLRKKVYPGDVIQINNEMQIKVADEN